MFKVGDQVISVLNDVDTDQIGTVIEATDTHIVVQPNDFPYMEFEYDLNGQHEEPEYKVRKKDVQ